MIRANSEQDTQTHIQPHRHINTLFILRVEQWNVHSVFSI